MPDYKIKNENTANKFRAENNGRLMRTLFHEMAMESKDRVLYTLKDRDWEGYPSIQRLYLELSDPSEYLIATTLFDGVEHWERICETEWFKPVLEKMRHSLDLKLKSEALQELIKDARSGSLSSKASAKYILDKGYNAVSPTKRRAGRPSKEEVARNAALQAASRNDLQDDFDRIQSIAPNA